MDSSSKATRRASLARILVLAVAMVACGGSEPPRTGSSDPNSDEVRVVENHDPSWSSGDEWVVDSEPRVRIGVRDGDPVYQFGNLVDVTALPNGWLATADDMNACVQIFDEDGVHVRTIGRSGGGPGEFTRVHNVDRYRGDSLFVYDYDQYRVSVLDGSGTFVRSVRSRHPGRLWVTDAFPDGAFFLWSAAGNGTTAPSMGTYWDSTVVVAMGPDGEESDTLGIVALREKVVSEGGRPRNPRLGAHWVRGTWSGGFFWGTGDRYEIRFYDQSGVLRKIVRREAEVRQVTQQDREAHRTGFIEAIRRSRGDGAADSAERNSEEWDWSETLPNFSNALVDGDDYLWVQQYSTYGIERRGWSVFDPNGTWLGEVVMPSGLEVTDIGRDYVAGIFVDEYDVQYAQVHPLRRDSR